MFRLFYRTFVEYTSIRHPEIKRKRHLQKISTSDIEYFQSILGKNRVLTSEVDAYNVDWNKSVRGQSKCVLKPKTTGEVSLIMKRCHERKLGVVPQGGNTGLVGGSNPVFDEIILSTESMNSILDIDVYSSIAQVQSGVILENLDIALRTRGLMVPLDLGSKGSCQVGGNASTNAGGLRFLRYGSLRGNIVGLEAVLPTGEILDCMSTMKKDNTGYDLKQLFLGSEGTLGIVTKVALMCPSVPPAINVAFLACNDFQNVLDIFVEARRHLSEILSSFEFMDHESMKAVTEILKLSSPIGTEDNFYVLIEVSGSNGEHNDEKLNIFLDSLTNIRNGTLASSVSQMKSIWELRERITESLLHDGYVYKYDVSLPLPEFYKTVEVMRQRLPGRRVVGYGHIGDGNLHLNATTSTYEKGTLDLIEPFIFEHIKQLGGSISAEHGIGLKKRNYLNMSKQDNAIKWMKEIKTLMDPHGILNPYKVFPDDTMLVT